MTALCEITACGKPGRFRDHCHVHGTIRGDLCGACNTRMGYVDKSPAFRLVGPNSLFRDYWLRCPGCAAESAGWWDADALLAEHLPADTPAWDARLEVTLLWEMKHDLERARHEDTIPATARIRAMILLWQTDPEFRARVDGIAARAR